MEYTIQYPSLRRNGELQWGNKPNKIIWHHPEWHGTPEGLNEMMISMGFVMCGYNFYIRKDGSIYAMRPINAIGGNCYGQNSCSIGFSFEGNYDEDQTMPEEQFNAGVWLTKYLMSQNSNITEVGPHRNYVNTACPGRYFPVDNMLNAVKGSAPIQNPTPARTTQEYQLWNTGAEVKAIQEKLIVLGYNLGQYGADGCFGKMTYDAVKAFQSSVGLTSDGIVGPKTMQALVLAVANKQKASTPAINPSVDHNKWIQHSLNITIHAGLVEDGDIGTKSIDAIKRFQSIMGISVDGDFGPTSEAVMKECLSMPILRIGCNYHYATRLVQCVLGITIDGGFGTNTANAVISFQKNRNLSGDGVVGPNTWANIIY